MHLLPHSEPAHSVILDHRSILGSAVCCKAYFCILGRTLCLSSLAKKRASSEDGLKEICIQNTLAINNPASHQGGQTTTRHICKLSQKKDVKISHDHASVPKQQSELRLMRLKWDSFNHPCLAGPLKRNTRADRETISKSSNAL